jgi:hypothetical protein
MKERAGLRILILEDDPRDAELEVHALRRVDPACVVSGYADDEVLRGDVSHAGSWYLQKPFSPDALGRKVLEALDAPREAGRARA